MDPLAIALLTVFGAGYAVVAGAGIGTGMLLPFLAQREERQQAVTAIGGLRMTGGAWLVALAGALAGLFPHVAGELVNGLEPLLVALLVGSVVREPGVARRAGPMIGGVVIAAGSWVAAVCCAWIVVSILALGAGGVVADPTAAIAVVAIVLVLALHGLAFAGVRSGGGLRRRSTQWFGTAGEGRAFLLTSAMVIGVIVAAGSRLPLTGPAAQAWPAAILTVVAAGMLAAQTRVCRRGHRHTAASSEDSAVGR